LSLRARDSAQRKLGAWLKFESAPTRKRLRGLSPDTALILTHTGSAFALSAKKRKLVGGEVESYLACDALRAHITRLYRDAGLYDCSSHSGRRTFATRLVAQGRDIEVVQRLLGHADLDHTDDHLDPNKRTLEAVFEGAL
jgi:integrase/recombinase XerD